MSADPRAELARALGQYATPATLAAIEEATVRAVAAGRIGERPVQVNLPERIPDEMVRGIAHGLEAAWRAARDGTLPVPDAPRPRIGFAPPSRSK